MSIYIKLNELQQWTGPRWVHTRSRRAAVKGGVPGTGGAHGGNGFPRAGCTWLVYLAEVSVGYERASAAEWFLDRPYRQSSIL
jgi:hypothetical protein